MLGGHAHRELGEIADISAQRARRAEMAVELALLEKNVAGLSEGASSR